MIIITMIMFVLLIFVLDSPLLRLAWQISKKLILHFYIVEPCCVQCLFDCKVCLVELSNS